MECQPTRVLLVEDDAADFLLVERSLRATPPPAPPFDLGRASALEEGLQRLSQQQTDVLLLDLHLPDSSGPDTVARVRQRDAAIPIVVFSTAGDEETALHALQAGAQDYLVKSEFNAALLRRAIRYAIERQEIARENERLKRQAVERAEELARTNETLLAEIARRTQAEKERAQLEHQIRQAHKLESVGILARGIAHDFNNLLLSVLGNSGLIELDLIPGSPVRRRVQQTRRAAQRAADLTNQLLTYSGHAKIAVQSIDLSALMKEMAHLIATTISKRVRIEYHLAPDLPSVEGDRVQLRQLVMNLITNASDAIGEKSGAICVGTGVVKVDAASLRTAELGWNRPEGRYVTLEVSDDGCGMGPETRSKLFDPFFTMRPDRRGLGLATVLGIVQSHGGAIRVESQPGRGSTFTILLPPRRSAAGSDPEEDA